MAERIGDTHWHNGKEYRLLGQTFSHETKTTVSEPINTRKALSIREGPIRLDNKAPVEKAILNKRTEYIIPDFKFTVRSSRQYSNAIKYLQESIDLEPTGEYDEFTATRVYSLVGDKLNKSKKYFSYYYGKVDLDAMMRGEHLPAYIHGVDEEVWEKLGLHPDYFKSDDHIYFWTLDYCLKKQSENNLIKSHPVETTISKFDKDSPLPDIFDLYCSIKDFLANLGSSYLGGKGFHLAKAMYLHGIYGEGKSLSFPDKQLLAEKIKNSDKLDSFLNTIIKQNKDKETIEDADTIEFEGGNDNDLFYSIQHCNLTYKAEKQGDAWKFDVISYDTYDFTELRILSSLLKMQAEIKELKEQLSKAFKFANMANDLGTVMQKIDMMKPYFWFVKFEIIKE